MYGEEQDLRDIKCYATDGSHKTSTGGSKDIITAEQTLRDAGVGAGGIVFMPRSKHETVHAIRIESDDDEPGMNAYTWELATQLIGLHFMKHMPPDVKGHSDCTSAIARTNLALQSFKNKLAHTTAGVLSTGAFQFADPIHPRLYSHIKAHPERYPERTAHPSELDKAIFMADSVAGGTSKPLGKLKLPVQVDTLKLRNIMNEIIPLHHWHFRKADDHAVPILGDLMDHQHQAQLTKMTLRRDEANQVQRWTRTALSFTHSVHPPKNKSHWAAARRALLVFDWMGHGRNRAKLSSLSPAQKAHEAKCRQCHRMDSQEHTMLECTHAPLTPIRCKAKAEQSKVAMELLKVHSRSTNMTYFIREITSQCWSPLNPDISRLWLGTWTSDTLNGAWPCLPVLYISIS